MDQEKTKKIKMIFIRIAYWFGILLDLLSALATTIYMIAPNQTFVNTIMNYPPINEGTFVILITETALMWGWTALLFWADRKPIERRGVLLLTAFPVVTMVIANSILGFVRNNPYISYVRLIVIAAFVLVVLGYILAETIVRTEKKQKQAVAA